MLQEIKKETLDSHMYQNDALLNGLRYWMVEQKVGHLRGEILTIIDAVLGGDDRLKSTKDLIHRAFNGHTGVLHDMAYTDSELEQQEMAMEAKTDLEYVRLTNKIATNKVQLSGDPKIGHIFSEDIVIPKEKLEPAIGTWVGTDPRKGENIC